MPVELEIVAKFSDVNNGMAVVNDGLTTINKSVKTVNDAYRDMGQKGFQAFKQTETGATNAVMQVENLRKKLSDLYGQMDKNKNNAGFLEVLKKQAKGVEDELTKLGVKLDEIPKKNPEPAVQGFKRLSVQIKEATTALNLAVDTYGEYSSEAIAAAREVANLTGKQTDLNNLIAALNPDAKLNGFTQLFRGIAGGFQAVIGGAALFGETNETVERSLIKINAAMAFANGINDILEVAKQAKNLTVVLGFTTAATKANTLSKEANAAAAGQAAAGNLAEGASTKVLAGGMSIATIATNILTVATRVLLGPLGLVLAAITAIVVVAKVFSDEGENFTQTLEAMKKSAEDFANATEDRQRGQQSVIANAERNLTLLQATNEKQLALMKEQGASEQEINAERIRLDQKLLRAKEAVANKINDQAESDLKRNKLRMETLVQQVNETVAKIKSGDLSKEDLATAGDLNTSAVAELRALRQKNEDLIELENQTDAKLAEDKIKSETDKANRDADAKQKELDRQKQQNEKLIQNRKEFNAAILDLQRKSNEAFATLLEDPQDRINLQRAQDEQELELLRKQLEEKSKAAGYGGKLTKDQEDQLAIIRLGIQKRFNDSSEKLERENQRAKLDLLNDGHEKQLAQFELDFKDNIQALKAKGFTEIEIQKLYSKQLLDLQNKQSLEVIDSEEKSAVALIEARERGKEDAIRFEKQKQVDILEVQQEFAQKRLELELAIALATGNNSPEEKAKIDQLRASLKKIQDQLIVAQSDLEKAVPKISLFKLLGLNGTPEEEAAFNAKVNEVVGGLIDTVSGLIDEELALNQARIDSNQQVIDSLSQRIEETQRGLELELQLNKQGFASNVDAKRKELAALEAQKKAALDRDKKLVEEQKKLAQEQQIASSIVQISSLLAAGAKLFEEGAFKGPLGIIAAIGTIGAMIGAFLSLKSKATEITKLEGGGTITGKRHIHGGKKFYAEDGEVQELEEGEEVTRRGPAQKYRRILKAINKENFTELNAFDLKPLLEGTGVKLPDEGLGAEASNKVVQYQTTVLQYQVSNGGGVKEEVAGLRKDFAKWKAGTENESTTHILPDGKRLVITRGGKDVHIIS